MIMDPKFFHEAIKDVKWQEAMAKEIERSNSITPGVSWICHSKKSLSTVSGFTK